MKVAKWEFNRNIKNKSFIISLFLTPLLFILFATLPSILSNMGSDSEPVTVYVNDEIGVWDSVQGMLDQQESINWDVQQTEMDSEAMRDEMAGEENAAYLSLTESALQQGSIPVYTTDTIDDAFYSELQILIQPLQQTQFEQLGLSAEQMETISRGVMFEPVSINETTNSAGSEQPGQDGLKRIVPGIFAGIILLSIVMTGMMIIQSASQEKKEKVAEIVLSSLTPAELMQGKIIGYFGLGITQVGVWLAFAVPLAVWRLEDVPVLEYLFVPELLILILIAILGYLLFAAIFVGLGATLEDISSANNLQGLLMMLPFLPFILIGPILSDPNGAAATIGSYFPFTAPGVLLLRLSMLEEWPWVEIIISLAILLVTVWLMMKFAGKVFKVGILMYGKNATPKEIWKWIKA